MVKYLATEVRWQDRRFHVPMERIVLSEELGYDAVFTAEGHGSDALTPLGYIAARTTRLKLGTRILQVTGRPPGIAARALMTLDHMAGGGRVIAGIGSASAFSAATQSGTAYGNPVARMRDYVAIMRQAFAGQALDHVGDQLSVPYRGGSGVFPPSPVELEPTPDIPIIVAASGPAITSLAAEVGDGWMPSFFAPGVLRPLQPLLDAGFERSGDADKRGRFEIWAHVDMLVDDDVRAAMRPFKEYAVQWSAMQRPFMEARGYTDLADRLAELVGAGRTEEAVEAVPDDYVDDGWLVGPVARIRERVKPWLDSELTGLIVRYGPQVGADRSEMVENLEAFRAVADAAGRAPSRGGG
jgi:alkanesulfonate monooxygenase SsuD/methylene tetrahydromethanopterin reductase-like flavin-dependent oxidoreductase (luciferase family)